MAKTEASEKEYVKNTGGLLIKMVSSIAGFCNQVKAELTSQAKQEVEVTKEVSVATS